jgi:hypothetical protein
LVVNEICALHGRTVSRFCGDIGETGRRLPERELPRVPLNYDERGAHQWCTSSLMDQRFAELKDETQLDPGNWNNAFRMQRGCDNIAKLPRMMIEEDD